MKIKYHYDSPLGGITLASDGKALTGLWFDGQKYFGSSLDNEENLSDTSREWTDAFGNRGQGFLDES